MGTLGTLAISIIGDSKDLDKTFDNVEKRASSTGQSVQKMGDGMFKAGIAVTGLGVGMAALGKQVEPLNQSIDRTAALTGIASDELRAMALDLTNVTFDLDSVTRGQERLVEAGIDTAESMAAILPIADDLADALGLDIVDSIDLLDRMSSSLGLELEDMGEHLDTLTFLATKSTVGMQELGMLMRREAQSMRDMGLSVDDVAVAMAALEAEGRRGPRAVMGFQEAIRGAEGDVESFWKELGVANQTLEEQWASLEKSAGITQELADINNRSLTIWDKLKQRYQEIIFEHGELVESGGHLGMMLAGIGPIIAGLGKGMSALTKSIMAQGAAAKVLTGIKLVAVGALKAFGIALKIALGPIGLIIIAVAALAYGVYMLIKHWDVVSDWFAGLWEKVKVIFSAAWEWLKGLFMEYHPAGILLTHWDEVVAWFAALGEGVKQFIGAAWEWLKQLFFKYHPAGILYTHWDGVVGFFSNIVDGIRRAFAKVYDFITTPFRRARETLEGIGQGIRSAIDYINPLARRSPSLVEQVSRGTEQMLRDFKRLETELNIAPLAHTVRETERGTIHHSFDPIVIKGVNDEGQLVGTARMIMPQFARAIKDGNRRYAARTSLSPLSR